MPTLVVEADPIEASLLKVDAIQVCRDIGVVVTGPLDVIRQLGLHVFTLTAPPVEWACLVMVTSPSAEISAIE